jgi:hypothetical protein
MPAPNPLLSRPIAAADASTLRAFERRLRSEKKSDTTVQSYLEAARLLAGWVSGGVALRRSGLPKPTCVRHRRSTSPRAL